MMQGDFTKLLLDIKSFFNLYVITFSSFWLLGLIKYLNKRYYNKDTPMKFLDMPIYSEYFSLIFGILFSVFIIVLYLKFHQLEMFENHISKNSIPFISWIASPLQTNISGLYIFVSLISLGIIYSLFLSIGHLFRPIPDECHLPPLFYRFIGAFDLIVFIVSSTLMYFLVKLLLNIRV